WGPGSKGTVNALKTISGEQMSPRLRICDERHHQRVKTEHERFFFRDISTSVHAAESRANPRDQRIAEPLTAFTVPRTPNYTERGGVIAAVTIDPKLRLRTAARWTSGCHGSRS